VRRNSVGQGDLGTHQEPNTEPLFNYSANRHARAIQVVELASSGMSTLVRLMESTFLRRWIVRHTLDRVAFLKYRVIWQLSGLGANTTVAN